MLALLLILALQPAAPPAALQPEPVAAPAPGMTAEPPLPLPASPVERRLPGLDGRPVRSLLHSFADPLPARHARLSHSIAVQRWIGASIAALPADQRTPTFICPLMSNGALASGLSCRPENAAAATPQLAQLVRLLYPAVTGGPALTAAAGPRAAMPRSLRFTLRLDPADWPPPWVPRSQPALAGEASSPLRTLIVRRYGDQYPPAALRAGVSALVMADCGVEADRSVSCRTLSIDPPASAPYFAAVVDQPVPRGVVPETLSDGRATPGLEFRVPLRFMMAD